MLETSARLLRLLSVLQTRRDWTSAELATRLGVTTRTIRTTWTGFAGSAIRSRRDRAWQEGTGSAPAARCRRCCSTTRRRWRSRSDCVPQPVARSPASRRPRYARWRSCSRCSRLRHRVSAFGSHMLRMPSPGPQVDPDVLTVIASACRDHERLRFDYRTHLGAASQRVEPYRLINDRRRWYLVAWDMDRDGWRTFRVDRIDPRTPAGPRFTPRALPPDQGRSQVARGVGEATWRYRARVIVHAPATWVQGRLPIPIEVESLGDDRCVFNLAQTIRRCSRSIWGCWTRTSRSWTRRASGRVRQTRESLSTRSRHQPARIRLVR